MDLVDIDKVLDNLELNEEEHRKEIHIINQRQILQTSDSPEPDVLNESLNESDHIALATPTAAGERPSRFVGVSQVFSSLDDYRKNVESLEPALYDMYKNNKTNDNTTSYSNVKNDHHELFSRDEETEEDPYGGDEINKFVSADEYGFSSNSITTSSSSTFSSGPSPALISTESESNVNGEELDGNNLPKENNNDNNKDNKTSDEGSPAYENDGYKGPKQEPSDFDDLAVGLSSISLTNQDSILSSSSSKYMLKTDNLNSSSSQITKNYLNSEKVNDTKPKDFVEKKKEDKQNVNNINLENSNLNLTAQQPNSQQNVMVTFSSTMDDISDTELDSILQEIDAEMSTQPLPGEDGCIAVEKSAESIEISKVMDHNGYSNKEVELVPENSSNISFGQKCDDGMNIDSFSQASTLEFTEDRPEMDDQKDSDDTYDGCSKEKDEYNPTDLQKKQRPTTLDLPVRKINLYATAGQTPPGSRIYDQSTSSSEEDNPEENLGATKNDEHVNFNDDAGHTPPERSDRAVCGATSLLFDTEPSNTDDPMIVSENTNVETPIPIPSESRDLPHNIGKVPPIWVPDQEASACMQCQNKFTLLKRRHHCRACGQVLCSLCCSQKFKLEFLSKLESRVCVQCFLILTKLQQQMDQQTSSTAMATSSPNPNNPMEYCSKIPPHRQVIPQPISYPTVIVPVGVLKKEGNTPKSRKRKSVMFSDGIRPGSDLASLDHKWSDAKHARKSVPINSIASDNAEGTTNAESIKIARNYMKSIVLLDDGDGCFIPTDENTLPPIMIMKKSEKKFEEVTNNIDLVKRLQSETLKFVIQTNFFVFVKISHLKCCINKTVINFTTCGLNNVGNDEIIILLELDNSNKIPKDMFVHLNEIYREASRGNPITELGFSMPKHLNFLGSREHGGFLFIRSTFQCLLDVKIPTSPFLIGVLIHRWEVPWAKVFPLRLMLRLGAQYRYYPSPHISVREREPVYAEIAQTIINLLADFRNYTYTIPTIKGMYIHMEDRRTNILIPRNRLDEVIKAINNSSDHILAVGANFSKKADGHLVCIQNIKSDSGDSHAYSTQAINIQGQPRKVTGASFFVLNEALKTTSGLSGKCSIIEDGLMVQILPSKMSEVRNALINMKDINIVCGPIEADEQRTEVVNIQWVDDDIEINIGVKSPIDLKKMDGIPSIRVHSGLTLSNNNHILKWTEVFIIEIRGENAVDVSKTSEQIAKNASVALLPFLDLLVANGNVKIGLRVSLNNDNVSYEAGSQNEKLPPLYMNALDNELIPTLHKLTNEIGKTIELELIFHILNVHINV